MRLAGPSGGERDKATLSQLLRIGCLDQDCDEFLKGFAFFFCTHFMDICTYFEHICIHAHNCTHFEIACKNLLSKFSLSCTHLHKLVRLCLKKNFKQFALGSYTPNPVRCSISTQCTLITGLMSHGRFRSQLANWRALVKDFVLKYQI